MLVKVKVFPLSKKEGVERKSQNSFEVKVKEKPLQGKANQRVTEVLASFLKLPASKVRLVRGSKRRNKIFEIIE
ncbi:MAG: DUF167 domain-containing protein [Candidatus Nealsonbacteria bacterium]|nr:DUF167 domain-containing protein [Candidatus Nealsonbacteria bacterium]